MKNGADPPAQAGFADLAQTQSHLSGVSDAAPYVRNPSPCEVADADGIGEDDKGIDAEDKWYEDLSHSRCLKVESEGAAERAEAKEPEFVEPGWRGWLDVLGTIVVNMMCYGMTQSFGVFQQYYETELLRGSSAMAISWIGAINAALCPMLGCFSGPLFDAGYLRYLVVVGGALYVFGLMMASISHEYYQVLLAHGLCVGIGMGTIFSPSVATLSHHFARSKHRNLAFGCQATGSAIAGIFFPISINYLMPAVGFGWTMRILAFIILLFATIAFFALSTTIPPRKKLAILSPSVYRNPAYTIYVSGACFGSLAIYAPFVFGVTYATSKGMPVHLANYAPAIMNGASLIGRLVPLIVAGRTGPINVFMTFALLSGTMQLFWTLTSTTATILLYDAIYGMISGGYGASLNPGAASFAPHTNQAGLYLGMCFFTNAWFWLAGAPATAALIDHSATYLPASMFCGGVVLVGGCLAVTSRFMRAKQVGSKWV